MSNDQYEPRQGDQSWQHQPSEQNFDDTRFTPATPSNAPEASSYGSGSSYPAADATTPNTFSTAPSNYPSADQSNATGYGAAGYPSSASSANYPGVDQTGGTGYGTGYGAQPQQGYPASASSASYPTADQTGYGMTAPQGYPSSANSASYPPPGQQGYPQQGYPQQGFPQQPYQAPAPKKKEGLAALFDFSFTTVATPSLAKIAYIFLVVMAFGGWLGGSLLNIINAISMTSYSSGSSYMISAIGRALVGWIPALVTVMFGRMALEFLVGSYNSREKIDQIEAKLADQNADEADDNSDDNTN